MARCRSEQKIENFKKAARELANNSVRPNVVLKAKEFINNLSYEEIDPSTLCRFGCPRSYLPKMAGLCDDPNTKATYSERCADCWYMALTEDKKTITKKPPKKPYKEGIEELLKLLGYKEGMDFDIFLDKIRKAKAEE